MLLSSIGCKHRVRSSSMHFVRFFTLSPLCFAVWLSTLQASQSDSRLQTSNTGHLSRDFNDLLNASPSRISSDLSLVFDRKLATTAAGEVVSEQQPNAPGNDDRSGDKQQGGSSTDTDRLVDPAERHHPTPWHDPRCTPTLDLVSGQ